MSTYRKRLLKSTKLQKVPSNADTTLNISSEKWLSVYGLKKLKLDFKQILSSVGFRNCDDYISILKKPVASRYSDGLFKKVGHNDGMFYNIIASKDGLKNVETRLVQAVDLYKGRLEWLTSGSRRSFGLINEKQISIVCDLQQESQEIFQFYQEIVTSVMREQIPSISKFNIARVTTDTSKWQPFCTSVNDDSLNDAISWWLDQVPTTEYSLTSAIETILDIACDKQVDAIYLFTDGSLLKGAKEIFLEKIKDVSVPVHIALVKSLSIPADADSFFHDVTNVTKGKYHYFSMPSGIHKHKQNNDQHHQPSLNEKGQGVRPDVMLIWEELDKARNTLFDVRSLISDVETGKLQKAVAKAASTAGKEPSQVPETEKPTKKQSEVYMDSKQWLQVHGLKKLKLTLHTFLKQSVFNHCDGVLDHADKSNSVLVNAQYCKKFAHMTLRTRWIDGSTKHVQITEPVYRKFREKMLLVLDKYKKRLEWLQNGSRELFGTIVENKVVLCIDTSSSMESKLHIVKDKLAQLLKEQLATKDSFNVISFNSKLSLWRESLVPCDLENLQNVLYWIDGLVAQGSTNTFGALNAAYGMKDVEALYLLSDGRPDQPADLILAQVNGNIPVHTISFNCADPEANQFLYEIAERTKGRYHHFSDDHYIGSGLPTPYQSEDLMLIRQEIDKGLKDLDAMLKLRNECLNKDLRAKEERGYTLRSRDDFEIYQSKRVTNNRQRPASAITYNQNKASLLRNGQYFPTKPITPKIVETSSTSSISSNEKKSKSNKKKGKKTDSEIKKWLRTNGLSGLKLNILDALAPTIINQKPTYVPALGKEVLSKVYGQILPIVHTNAGKEFQLVNPQAVDLVSYEERLKTALENIERKLNDFAFTNLSESFKDSVDTEEFSFFDMKDDIYNDLREHAVPRVLKDVKLLEKEIEQGNLYLNQSKDLREVVQQLSKEAKEEREKNNRSKNSSSKQNNRPETAKSRNGEKKKFRYHRVLARSDGDGLYYPAIVSKYVNARFVNVLFDDGENQLTCVRYLVPIGGSAPCPALNVGDYVLTKCYKTNEDIELTSAFYVPGIVQVTPLKMRSTTKCYTVIKFNGNKMVVFAFTFRVQRAVAEMTSEFECTALRKDLVKITRSRFVFSVKFIQEIQQQLVSSTRQREFDPVQTSSRRDHRRSSNDSSHSDRTERSYSTSLSHPENARDDVSGSGNEHSEGDRESEPGLSDHSDDDTGYANDDDNNKNMESDVTDAVSELQKRLEEQHEMKMKELEEQKTLLLELHEKLTVNAANQNAQYEELEKERSKFYKEQQEFLEKQLKSQSDEPRVQFKDLSEMQMDIFKRQQEQQEKLIDRLLDKEKELLRHQNSLQEIIDTSVDDSKAQNEDQNTPDTQEEKPPINADMNKVSKESSEHLSTSHAPPEEKTSRDSDVKDDDDDEIKILVSPRSDAMLMAKGDSGIFVSRNPLELDPSVATRQVLGPVKLNDEVLARFKDDGWYYRGIVKKIMNNSLFAIEDGVGSLEEVHRLDVITDADDADKIIQIHDHVIAFHPVYLHAYAPGIVLDVENEGGSRLKVHFYDGEVSTVPRAEAYLISPTKFDSDCNFIRMRECALIGQAVVCQSIKTGVYQLGMVRDRVGGCRNYLIEWADQSLEIQNYAFIFGAHTKRQSFNKGDHILAVSNQDTFSYLPGTVVDCDGNLLHVEFCDSQRLKNVDANQSFWLSEDYFRMASQHWKDKMNSA